MTKHVAGWFQLMLKYNYETVMMITNLEIMYMSRYYGWKNSHDYGFILPNTKFKNTTQE